MPLFCGKIFFTNTLEPVTVETAKELGLRPEEFDKICNVLGRTPNFCELSIYSVMWSEHCSYKNSIKWLKTLPRESDKMLANAGEENAGLIDVGNGLACCFKIESHNHPSALEPYQGAATGVGGINRDIFSMGARPIAQLNSLRFGNLENERTQWLLKGVVKGIGDYGNAFGIPTVGGEVYFDECYQVNPLVNAMSVGIVEHGKTVSAIAEGLGNKVYIFGSSTGKDGIHGAAFASKNISEDSVNDLPSVQVGDPFWEKLILEASLEIIETGGVIGLQDMGAAGITCSTSEMTAKGECGMDVWLDKVPTRQPGMKDWEILLSESQERMLVVVKQGYESKLEEIFEKWDLTYNQIGVVTDGKNVRFYMNDNLVADIPAESLVLGGGAPVYDREYSEPAYIKEIEKFDLNTVKDIELNEENLKNILGKMLANPNIASKRWVYNQYDSMVGTITQTTNKPSDAAVVKLRGTDKSIVMTVDCNSRYVYSNPLQGGAIAVAEAARNIVCTGGVPLGVTNCLNFGNPYMPGVYWQFVNAVTGMGNACRKFGTPVTGGNVSFYNQSSDENAVFPTPTIGMIGLMDTTNHMTLDFKNVNDSIFIIGQHKNDLGSSQYLAKLKGVEQSPCPYFDMDEEYNIQQAVTNIIEKKLIQSAHDVSDGGLLVCIMESAFASDKGFKLNTNSDIRKDAFLFGEAQSRVIVTVSENNIEKFENNLKTANISFSKLGNVTASEISVDGIHLGSQSNWKPIYDNSIENHLN
ncbi:MAG: phosphoribosylformylglycinamidine synthase subunit PurL [Bacteroidota bacterium]|nr:phosphoribosylformylglycinamidine synthase subunit PurL [Bacteroidota bacterium]